MANMFSITAHEKTLYAGWEFILKNCFLTLMLMS